MSPRARPFLKTASNFAQLRLGRGPGEGLLGHAEAHREHGPVGRAVDLVADRLEQVREALHALGLRRGHAEQHDVRQRRHRVGPLDVEVRLARPARGAAGARLAVADVLVVLAARLADLVELRVGQVRVEAVVEDLQVVRSRRASVGVDEHDRLAGALEPGGGVRRVALERVDAIGPGDVRRAVAVVDGVEVRLGHAGRSVGRRRRVARVAGHAVGRLGGLVRRLGGERDGVAVRPGGRGPCECRGTCEGGDCRAREANLHMSLQRWTGVPPGIPNGRAPIPTAGGRAYLAGRDWSKCAASGPKWARIAQLTTLEPR